MPGPPLCCHNHILSFQHLLTNGRPDAMSDHHKIVLRCSEAMSHHRWNQTTPSTMKSLAQFQSPGREFDADDGVPDQRIIVPNKLITIADCFQKKEHSWFIASQIPTDFSIQVQGITYNVHKFPLVSKCGFIGRREFQTSITESDCDLKLDNFPGGTETFEMILRYCYGFQVDLNPNIVAPLRCASELLEMTEELEDGNLIAKTEAFLTFVVLSSWKDSISVLKSCETLSPWAENIQLVRRCCDSIAWKASRENLLVGDKANEDGWWFDDVSILRIDHFIRIITAIKAKGAKPESIGKCIMHYANKWLPTMGMEIEGNVQGINYLKFSNSNARKDEVGIGRGKEQRTIIESLVSILLSYQEDVTCKFLLQMLKMAMAYSASPALITELEKRIGAVLEDADVNDLLIPNYKNVQNKELDSQEECTMHDIEVVQRIIEYFLMHDQQHQHHKSGKANISKLIDIYLAEIARDPNLSITKFQVLAESLTENARACHDGLYRAIDTYLKTHQSLSEYDRKRLCKTMNCEKLSSDACMHAAQNERLPLRIIVQVLLSEQIKMRRAMQEKEQEPSNNVTDREASHSATDREIKSLKAELENVLKRMQGLQNDYSELHQEYEKLNGKQKNVQGWSSRWRKIKNSFQTKVEGDETEESTYRSSPSHRRISSRRRQSIS